MWTISGEYVRVGGFERVNVRVGVPTNLCVKESWSECALESLRGSGVSVFALLIVRMDG